MSRTILHSKMHKQSQMHNHDGAREIDMHKGPLETPMGIIPATGKRTSAPCCDVFHLKNGEIQKFDCYTSGAIIFSQLGVLTNL
jgi:hypothetical protein